MKKTLLALAAVAASSAAFAQSSVTLYGIADVSVESVKGASTVSRVTSGNLSTSRLGFKGVEDLGEGLKAIFQLESGISVDTGAANTTRFFDRNAYVGLTGGFGTVRLGRDDSLIGLVAAGPLATVSTYDELRLLPTRAADSYRRADNSITYVAPTFVPGLTVAAQYSTAAIGSSSTTTGTETANDSFGKTYGLSANYVAGPLSAGVGYLNVKDAVSSTTVSEKANAALVYGAYDFGVAKVTAYYDAETSPALKASSTAVLTSANSRRLTVLGAKVAVPVSSQFTVIGGAATARNVNGSTAGNDNAQVFTLRGIYSLSKRTSVYALFTNVNNDTNTNLAVGGVTGANDQTSRGIAAGIRHAF
ncbi:porin [Aquabacterium sp.]|jgi:GBP family porin|uniref:porin n=1 Tax=Aquabacterium sp. TaxID=1872578 RepID=UPI0025C24507|nr:porin [Aquabacterium sp.]